MTTVPPVPDTADLPQLPTIPDRQVDIRDHGAEPGGKALNTAAIAAAIERCSAAGGGRVVVPAGVWLTGAIHLRSHIELHLAEGAELRFSQDPADYLPVVFMQRGGVECYGYSPFVYAHRCHDIAITGRGLFNGRGEPWWAWKHRQPGMAELFEQGARGVPVDQRVFGTEAQGVRPPFVQPIYCERVLIEGVRFQDGPSWMIHPVCCDHLTVRHVAVQAPEHAHNTDGIDPDGCRHVLIEHCHIDTGDDGICLKAGRDEDAWRIDRPLEHVLVRHCKVKAAHGGIVLGSEMSGGIRHVHVHDCEFDGTDCGIRIKSKRGRGGAMEHVRIHDIAMRRIRDQAIIITCHYERRMPQQGPAPLVRHIDISDVRCESAGEAILLDGLHDEPLRDITLRNIHIRAARGMTCENVAGLAQQNITLEKTAEAR